MKPEWTKSWVKGRFVLCSSVIQSELSNMSFEDILKLQSKVGTRVFNEVAYGSQQPEGGQKKKKKRLNKNR